VNSELSSLKKEKEDIETLLKVEQSENERLKNEVEDYSVKVSELEELNRELK